MAKQLQKRTQSVILTAHKASKAPSSSRKFTSYAHARCRWRTTSLPNYYSTENKLCTFPLQRRAPLCFRKQFVSQVAAALLLTRYYSTRHLNPSLFVICVRSKCAVCGEIKPGSEEKSSAAQSATDAPRDDARSLNKVRNRQNCQRVKFQTTGMTTKEHLIESRRPKAHNNTKSQSTNEFTLKQWRCKSFFPPTSQHTNTQKSGSPVDVSCR